MRSCSDIVMHFKAQVDIVQSIGHYVRLRRAGAGFIGLCPFHTGGRSSSLAVHRESATFRCFGCGKSGDAIQFVRDLEGGISSRHAIKLLADRQGIDLPPFPDHCT
ncbi:MAG TPA: CHC2 zinc finger domain-containing protein [Bryobacteraceae bacterium]|nr:CHC2 zinc finger domain-containing protein [Bryobacteraceae bacterium]